MIFLNLYISIEIWIRNTLLQKFLWTDTIFSINSVPTVKFAEFMIPIALPHIFLKKLYHY